MTTNELANLSAQKIPRLYQEGFGSAGSNHQTLTLNVIEGTGSNVVSLDKMHVKGNLTVNVSALTSLSTFNLQACTIEGNLIVNFYPGTSSLAVANIQLNNILGSLTVNVQQGFNGPNSELYVQYNNVRTSITT
jgi:hypothetical protein